MRYDPKGFHIIYEGIKYFVYRANGSWGSLYNDRGGFRQNPDRLISALASLDELYKSGAPFADLTAEEMLYKLLA